MKVPERKFDIEYDSIVNVLNTSVRVSLPFDPNITRHPHPPLRPYLAIWDTGATNTVITNKVVNELGLTPSGKIIATGVNSTSRVDSYLVNLYLPNHVAIPNVRVAELSLQGADVLIGMDIIQFGDFAISNVGKTRFSFRIPSIDPNLLKNGPGNSVPKIDRNQLVRIKNKVTGDVKEMKFKKAAPLIESTSDWELI